jgi:transposase
LVQERTRFKNKIRAELAKRGIRALKNPFAKRRGPALRELGIETVNNCLDVRGALDERIRRVSTELKAKAEESEGAKLLMTIPGVGHFSALAILAEMGISQGSAPLKSSAAMRASYRLYISQVQRDTMAE